MFLLVSRVHYITTYPILIGCNEVLKNKPEEQTPRQRCSHKSWHLFLKNVTACTKHHKMSHRVYPQMNICLQHRGYATWQKWVLNPGVLNVSYCQSEAPDLLTKASYLFLNTSSTTNSLCERI